jgi:hypothetical protein
MESLGMEDRWEEISSGDFEINHFVDLLRHVQLKPVKESRKWWNETEKTKLHQAESRFRCQEAEIYLT